MAFSIHEEYIDSASGFHVIKLRDGKKEHVLQIGIGHCSCPACGAVHPKTNLGELDPKAATEAVIAALNESHIGMTEYAKKHGIPVK